MCAGTARAPRWRAPQSLVTPNRPTATAGQPPLARYAAARDRRDLGDCPSLPAQPFQDRCSFEWRCSDRAASAVRSRSGDLRPECRRTYLASFAQAARSASGIPCRPTAEKTSARAQRPSCPRDDSPPAQPPVRTQGRPPARTQCPATWTPGPASRRAAAPTAARAHPASYWPQRRDRPPPQVPRPSPSGADGAPAGRWHRQTPPGPSPTDRAVSAAPAATAACPLRDAASLAGSQKRPPRATRVPPKGRRRTIQTEPARTVPTSPNQDAAATPRPRHSPRESGGASMSLSS